MFPSGDPGLSGDSWGPLAFDFSLLWLGAFPTSFLARLFPAALRELKAFRGLLPEPSCYFYQLCSELICKRGTSCSLFLFLCGGKIYVKIRIPVLRYHPSIISAFPDGANPSLPAVSAPRAIIILTPCTGGRASGHIPPFVVRTPRGH